MASDLVDAPYVGEFPFVLECKVVHVAELGLHTLFAGEILDVKVEEGCLDAKGTPTAELVRPIWWGPSENQYYGLGEDLGRGFSVGRALETGTDGPAAGLIWNSAFGRRTVPSRAARAGRSF